MEKTDKTIAIHIKASNQFINDQVINCELDWTIKQLKSHLSSVYPTKPRPDGQKLIYSGKILSDGAVLSEILRTYDGQQNNIIHLVCSPSKECVKIEQQLPQTNSNLRRSLDITSVHESNSPPLESHDPNNEFRRRMPYMHFGNPLPYFNETHDQQHMYQQMVWMQQVYMQYMAQCMQAYQGQNIPPEIHEREPIVQPEQNEVPQNGVEGEEEAEEEGHLNRDWLDWLYIVSRCAVFLSLVYFYSSPLRCIMFTTMTFLLYHLGMLRWRPLQNNNNLNNNNNRVVVQDDLPAGNGNGPEQPHITETPQQTPYPNWLHVAWTFLSSFFLSLIPDQWEV